MRIEDYDENIISAFKRLDEEGKNKLLKQISNIDLAQMTELYELTKGNAKCGEDIIEPMSYTDANKLSKEEKEKYIEVGKNIIKDGKLAVVTMAGGQGTRLGHKGPKGTFDMGLESHKSLFEILADILKLASKKYGHAIDWYIMTSSENNDETEKFFKEHNYFDYPSDGCITFFEQGKLPMLDEDGKILIDENGFVKEAANGNGGVFASMFSNGILDNMKKRGTEWVFIGGVDNPLCQMADPLFIGFTSANNYMASSKTLKKASPEENVGVFCKRNGKPATIEYTEISKELAHKVDENGELVYGESHVMLNLFNISAIEKVKDKKLPYHVAHKKATCLDLEGNVIAPQMPNAYKFETFIVDVFPLLDNVGLLRGNREDEFAPIKNATGIDSPETAKELYIEYHNKYKE